MKVGEERMSQSDTSMESCPGGETKNLKPEKWDLASVFEDPHGGRHGWISVNRGKQRGGEGESRGSEWGGPCRPCGRIWVFTPSQMGSPWSDVVWLTFPVSQSTC